MNNFRKPLIILGAIFSILPLMASTAMASNREVPEISFEEDFIEGDLLSAAGFETRTPIDEDTSSLIQLRDNFMLSMIKSA